MDYTFLAGLPFFVSMFVTFMMGRKMENYMRKNYPLEWSKVFEYQTKMLLQYGEFVGGTNYAAIPKSWYYGLKSFPQYHGFIFSNKYNTKGKIKYYKQIMKLCWILTWFSFFVLTPLLAFSISYLQGNLVY